MGENGASDAAMFLKTRVVHLAKALCCYMLMKISTLVYATVVDELGSGGYFRGFADYPQSCAFRSVLG